MSNVVAVQIFWLAKDNKKCNEFDICLAKDVMLVFEDLHPF